MVASYIKHKGRGMHHMQKETGLHPPFSYARLPFSIHAHINQRVIRACAEERRGPRSHFVTYRLFYIIVRKRVTCRLGYYVSTQLGTGRGNKHFIHLANYTTHRHFDTAHRLAVGGDLHKHFRIPHTCSSYLS